MNIQDISVKIWYYEYIISMRYNPMSFRKNDSQQLSLFDAFHSLTPREQRVLEHSWAKVFADEVFPAIDEDRFSVLYSEKASMLKDMLEKTDVQAESTVIVADGADAGYTPLTSNYIRQTGTCTASFDRNQCANCPHQKDCHAKIFKKVAKIRVTGKQIRNCVFSYAVLTLTS